MSETVLDSTGSTANPRYRGLKPFQKGQSGNPNGRPKKVREVENVATDNLDKALRKLVKLIDSDDEKVALAAANAVIDRAVGKPRQSMDVSNTRKNASDYSESELLAIAGLGGSRTDPKEESANLSH